MTWIPLLMWFRFIVASAQQCRTTYFVSGRYLEGHVISTHFVKSMGQCVVTCSNDQRCQSINFKFNELICELNDADRQTHPWDYKTKEGYAYKDYLVEDMPMQKEYFMTPSLLKAHASYIDKYHSIENKQIKFNKGSSDGALLLKIPLVNAGILSEKTPLKVEIKVAIDASIGQTRDSDIDFGLSDGTNFIGFRTVDKRNYDNVAPCFGLEGAFGAKFNQFDSNYPIPNDKTYPSQFNLTLIIDKPCRGICLTEHDGGLNKTVEYRTQLKLSQGLNFQVYKMQKREMLGIENIMFSIVKLHKP